MDESESEQAENEEGDEGEVEECPGARAQARRRATASAHEAALRAAVQTDMAIRAAAAAPGDNVQRRGTKRSAHTAGHDAETTGDIHAAQHDDSARGSAAEETHGPGPPSPGQVELTKPENWASMSKREKCTWKKNRAKHKGNTSP